MDIMWFTFVDVVASQSMMSVDGKEIPGKALEKKWCLSLFLKAGRALGTERVVSSIPGSVGYIYPMFIEPTIIWAPSEFSGYIWLDTKIVLKKERRWMKDDMETYSKCLRQRMRKTWTLPLQFFLKEHILTRKKKIAVIVWAHSATYHGTRAAR